MQKWLALALVPAAFAGGFAWAQDAGSSEPEREIDAKLTNVRREVKVIDLDATLPRLPALFAREKDYTALVKQITRVAQEGGDLTPHLERVRLLKLDAFKELNDLLQLHRGKDVGLGEEQVWKRLREAQFEGVHYSEEWLVNILDDLEAAVGINIELDARVYKFDTVSFDFERTSALAMLQMMADALLFKWVVRGDTLYVYKERHEILFGGEWLARKRAAWKARKEALEKARKEAERRALEGAGGEGGGR